jgi:membrane-bound lytic murein transglycosylase MltF
MVRVRGGRKAMKTIKVNNREIEIASEDAPEQVSWNDSMEYAKSLGNDWRLPTKDELKEMYKNKETIGGFVAGYYWSSSEYNSFCAWGQAFYDGSQHESNKIGARRVRCVRDVVVNDLEITEHVEKIDHKAKKKKILSSNCNSKSLQKIKIKVQDYSDRTNIVIALANAGIDVHVEKETYLRSDTYYVVFEWETICTR